MKCWSCGKTISETAQFCSHCEAEVEEPPTEEVAAAVREALSTLNPAMIDQMREIAAQSSDGEDFVNRIMVGPCPNCDSDSTTHCEHDPDIEDPCVGRCLECGQLWCCDCEVLFADENEVQQHECPEAARWEEMLDDDDWEDAETEDSEGPMDLDDIVESFKVPFGVLPVAAMRAAQDQAGAITPRLIELLDEAVERQRNGDDSSDNNAHMFSLFLLFEFKAKEALPALVKLLHLPGDGAYDLIGDALTEDVPRMLAAWLDEDLKPLDDLIRDNRLDEFVRWEGAITFLHLVRDGRLSRADAAARLEDHLRWACDQSDQEIATGLVMELSNLAMASTLPTIERAYSLDLVDEFTVGDLEDLRDKISVGEEECKKRLSRLRATNIEDAVAELQQWACFQESPRRVAPDLEEDHSLNRPAVSLPDVELMDDAYDEDSGATVRNEIPRVGRNETCPCGSGKKYKQCCGRQ